MTFFHSILYMIRFISDIEHYDIVLNLVSQAHSSVWLGTADIKDLYVRQGKEPMPFLGLLNGLIRNGINIRLIHAKEPGRPFLADFDKYPLLALYLERVLCPRVHFKIILIDSVLCYLGSANLTGAGMGMKSPYRRNFEAGIITDESAVVNAAIEEFDKVWRGAECNKCQRKQFCSNPIV